jgi:hypothetical protein
LILSQATNIEETLPVVQCDCLTTQNICIKIKMLIFMYFTMIKSEGFARLRIINKAKVWLNPLVCSLGMTVLFWYLRSQPN